MLNTAGVKTGQLPLKRILSVQCPVCRAKPREQCTLTTGHPSIRTHAKREVAAAKAPRPEGSGQAALRYSICHQWLPVAVSPQVGDMLQNQNKLQNQMCFQVHKDGAPVDGVSYPTLAEASIALENAAQGG